MVLLTHLPDFVTIVFKGMPTVWKSYHRLVFCWFVYMQALTPNKKTITELSRYSPARITEWRLRRLIYATYLNYQSSDFLVCSRGNQMFSLSRRRNRLCCGRRQSQKQTRQKKTPLFRKAQKVRGVLFSGKSGLYWLLSVGMYIGFRIILPKNHPDYKNENALFREMISDPTLPEWAETVIIIGDSAYGSKDNMEYI